MEECRGGLFCALAIVIVLLIGDMCAGGCAQVND